MGFLFLGFPMRWEQFFALLTGLIIVIVAYRTPRAIKMADENAIPFVEHKPEAEVLRSEKSQASSVSSEPLSKNIEGDSGVSSITSDDPSLSV